MLHTKWTKVRVELYYSDEFHKDEKRAGVINNALAAIKHYLRHHEAMSMAIIDVRAGPTLMIGDPACLVDIRVEPKVVPEERRWWRLLTHELHDIIVKSGGSFLEPIIFSLPWGTMIH